MLWREVYVYFNGHRLRNSEVVVRLKVDLRQSRQHSFSYVFSVNIHVHALYTPDALGFKSSPTFPRPILIIYMYTGHFQSIKTDILQIFLFTTSDKTECLSPMMF